MSPLETRRYTDVVDHYIPAIAVELGRMNALKEEELALMKERMDADRLIREISDVIGNEDFSSDEAVAEIRKLLLQYADGC